jgi:uridine phosphorylase
MSIIHSFDNKSEEILKPTHLSKKIENFPEIAVAMFNERYTEIIENLPDVEIITRMHYDKIPIYKINHRNTPITVYISKIGGAAAVAHMELMIVKGIKKFVFFGSCGTLDKNISSGNFIIPTAAYRDEGTSYHYLPAGDYIKIKTADTLSQIMSELGLPHIKAKTWTTDAIFRETKNNMEKRKAEGCLTVEMECASIMAAAQFRGVEVYQFLHAEDNLDSTEWERRNMGSVTMDTREKYLYIALDIANSIVDNRS